MKKVTLLATAAIALIFSACDRSKFEGYTQSENGLYYKFLTHDENGAKVQEGDGMTLRYVIMNQKNDSVIVDSKTVSRDGSGYTQFVMQQSSFKGSFEDGMKMMAKGDSAAFIIPADSFFLKSMRYNELPKGFKSGDYLKATFKIKEITPKKEIEEMRKKQMAEQQVMMKEAQGKEQGSMDKYLADNKVTAKPTASGLYVVEVKKGNGSKPKAGDEVEVNYTGRLIDGTIFDTSVESDAKAGNTYNPQNPYKPIKFVLGRGQVIKGWDEGIALLSKGEKAKFIIPSTIAYGAQGGGPIPPFSTLVFDVELVSFGPAPAQPAMPAQPGH